MSCAHTLTPYASRQETEGDTRVRKSTEDIRQPGHTLRRFRVIVSACAAVALTGCVSNKYKAASAVGMTPQRIDANLGGDTLQTTLNAVVVYRGPGSWKKEALWDELIVTLVNQSEREVVIRDIVLFDKQGTAIPAGSDPWLLEKASTSQRKLYHRTGLSFALNTVGYAAFTYGAAGAGAFAGAAMSSSWGGLATGATVGLVAVPVTAVVVYAKNQKNKQAIEGEFRRRRISLPLTLQVGESRTGSLFFPMSLSPHKMTMQCTSGGLELPVELPTPMLAGLHEPPPGK